MRVWFAASRGSGKKVTKATRRWGAATQPLRNWQLQASNDGAEWTTLRAHTNDEALATTAFSTASWAVEGGKGAFAQFRVLSTGKSYYLSAC